MRPIPELAVDFVAQWEGCKLTAYRDVVGVLTIGYGSTGPHVVEGLTITKAKARALLREDLQIARKRLYDRIGPVVEDLTDAQYAALLSFVFNLGANPKWTIWKVLKARKFDEVPPQIMRFTYAGGKVVKGLVNRRAAECALWATVGVEEGPAEPVPPSSVTRSTPTPPVPTDSKPLATSKSFITTAATTIAAAGAGVAEVTRAVSPYAEQSEVVGRIVATLALIAAVLAVAALVFTWLKRKRA